MHRSTLAGCDVTFDLCVSRAVTSIKSPGPLIPTSQCAAELGHEWTIDHSSEARHNAALQETFVYRT